MNFIIAQFIKTLMAWLVLIGLCYVFAWSLPGEGFQYDISATAPANLQLRGSVFQNQNQVQGLLQYYKAVLSFDLGKSPLYEQRSVSMVVLPALSVTFRLSLVTFIFVCVGIYWLLFFSWNFPSIGFWTKTILMTVVQVPVIVWAPCLIYFFSYQFQIFPVAFLTSAWHYVLPVLVLSLRPICHGFLILNEEVNQLTRDDVLKFAFSKGLSARQVFRSHILRLLLPKFLNFFLPTMAGLLSGALIVEFLFAIKGLGFLFYQAFESRDLYLVSAICLVTGSYFLFLKFTANLLTHFFDPRPVPEFGVQNEF